MNLEFIRRLAVVFQVREEVITTILGSDDDLYTGLAKHFQCDRSIIKTKVHVAMYNIGPTKLKDSLKERKQCQSQDL